MNENRIDQTLRIDRRYSTTEIKTTSCHLARGSMNNGTHKIIQHHSVSHNPCQNYSAVVSINDNHPFNIAIDTQMNFSPCIDEPISKGYNRIKYQPQQIIWLIITVTNYHILIFKKKSNILVVIIDNSVVWHLEKKIMVTDNHDYWEREKKSEKSNLNDEEARVRAVCQLGWLSGHSSSSSS